MNLKALILGVLLLSSQVFAGNPDPACLKKAYHKTETPSFPVELSFEVLPGVGTPGKASIANAPGHLKDDVFDIINGRTPDKNLVSHVYADLLLGRGFYGYSDRIDATARWRSLSLSPLQFIDAVEAALEWQVSREGALVTIHKEGRPMFAVPAKFKEQKFRDRLAQGKAIASWIEQISFQNVDGSYVFMDVEFDVRAIGPGLGSAIRVRQRSYGNDIPVSREALTSNIQRTFRALVAEPPIE